MSDASHADLQRALQITVEMLDAAAGDNWDRVRQLDAERDQLLRKHPADVRNGNERETIAALLTHNQTLMVHAEAARDAVKRQLDQHQYKHRALRTYLSSSASG
jgi:hypothetical protein